MMGLAFDPSPSMGPTLHLPSFEGVTPPISAPSLLPGYQSGLQALVGVTSPLPLMPPLLTTLSRPSSPLPVICPPIEYAYTRWGKIILEHKMSSMLGFTMVESSASAEKIFLQKNLAIIDFCESKYKEAESRVAGLTEEVAKWKHYA